MSDCTDADKTCKHILLAVERQFYMLTKEKRSGKFYISFEFNVSQGSIGDVYVENHSRERVMR